jgi:hypothetical protein
MRCDGAPGDLHAARDRHHVRHPVAGREGRVEPLRDEDARIRLHLRQRRSHAIEPGAHPAGHLVGRGLGAEANPQTHDARQHLVERRRGVVNHVDVERGCVRDLVQLIGRDGANLAELLRYDDVGVDLGPHVRVDRVERLVARGRLGHRAIDVGTRQLRGLDERRGHSRSLGGLRRPVALVRHADHLISEPQREEDLGGRGNERADPHGPYASCPPGGRPLHWPFRARP